MQKMIEAYLESKINRMEEFFKENNTKEDVRKEMRKRLKTASKSLIKYFKCYGVPENFQLDITGNGEWMLSVPDKLSVLFKDAFNFESSLY